MESQRHPQRARLGGGERVMLSTSRENFSVSQEIFIIQILRFSPAGDVINNTSLSKQQLPSSARNVQLSTFPAVHDQRGYKSLNAILLFLTELRTRETYLSHLYCFYPSAIRMKTISRQTGEHLASRTILFPASTDPGSDFQGDSKHKYKNARRIPI
jgi:hypothetical protein